MFRISVTVSAMTSKAGSRLNSCSHSNLFYVLFLFYLYTLGVQHGWFRLFKLDHVCFALFHDSVSVPSHTVQSDGVKHLQLSLSLASDCRNA